MNEQTLKFTYRGEGERMDKFLVGQLPDLSRSRIQALIRDGAVCVDEDVVSKSGCMLDDAQVVTINLPATVSTELIPEDIPLDVIFENSDLMLINKPAGMVVHPAAGHDTGTLVHAALAHAPEMEGIGGELRPGIVHRLDKDTSGLILIAKNDLAHRWLQNQFRTRKVKKTYLALVDGKPPTPTGRIEASIGRDSAQRRRMAVVSPGKGRESITEYQVVESFPEHTLLEAYPFTGRTHQIRLHMAFLGCPIAGDTLYGHRHPTVPIERHFLHAIRLDVILPGETSPSHFEAPLPDDLQECLLYLRSR